VALLLSPGPAAASYLSLFAISHYALLELLVDRMSERLEELLLPMLSGRARPTLTPFSLQSLESLGRACQALLDTLW
jgi:hypothetical protein